MNIFFVDHQFAIQLLQPEIEIVGFVQVVDGRKIGAGKIELAVDHANRVVDDLKL